MINAINTRPCITDHPSLQGLDFIFYKSEKKHCFYLCNYIRNVSYFCFVFRSSWIMCLFPIKALNFWKCIGQFNKGALPPENLKIVFDTFYRFRAAPPPLKSVCIRSWKCSLEAWELMICFYTVWCNQMETVFAKMTSWTSSTWHTGIRAAF